MTPEVRANIADFSIGDRRSFKVEITEEVVRRFVDLTGDTNPVHLSDEFAAAVGLSRRVVHGMACASFLSRLVGIHLPGPGALWAHQSLAWHKPVRVGDTLTVIGEVVHVSTGQMALTLHTEVFDGHGELVLSGTGQVTLPSATVTTPTSFQSEGPMAPLSSDSTSRRVALVTGGAGGVGSRLCSMLAAAGFDVAIHFRGEEERCQILCKRLRSEYPDVGAIMVQADLSKVGEEARIMDQIAEELAPPQVLVLNASPRPVAVPLQDLIWDDDIAPHLNVSLRAHLGLIQRALPFMKERRFGRIVGVITNSAVSTPIVGWTAYTLAKVAMRSLLQSVAAECGPYGITGNGVLPGLMPTSMTEGVSERSKELTARRTPTRRLTQPVDVANAIMFLISPAADQINGVMLSLDGGERMQ